MSSVRVRSLLSWLYCPTEVFVDNSVAPSPQKSRFSNFDSNSIVFTTTRGICYQLIGIFSLLVLFFLSELDQTTFERNWKRHRSLHLGGNKITAPDGKGLSVIPYHRSWNDFPVFLLVLFSMLHGIYIPTHSYTHNFRTEEKREHLHWRWIAYSDSSHTPGLLSLDCRIHAVNEGKLHSPHRGKDTPISTPKDPRNIWLSSCLKTVHFHAKFQFDQLCLS